MPKLESNASTDPSAPKDQSNYRILRDGGYENMKEFMLSYNWRLYNQDHVDRAHQVIDAFRDNSQKLYEENRTESQGIRNAADGQKFDQSVALNDQGHHTLGGPSVEATTYARGHEAERHYRNYDRRDHSDLESRRNNEGGYASRNSSEIGDYEQEGSGQDEDRDGASDHREADFDDSYSNDGADYDDYDYDDYQDDSYDDY